MATEHQLTKKSQSHVLTNVNVWSPDGHWIVYDVRTGDGFNGSFIEQVNVETGEVQRLYESRNGANCGVVTYSPVNPQVVFIHGPENPTPEWSYGFTHRRGALVDVSKPGVSHPLDAMNYASPFAAGALRGGSHVHVFSPDGKRVSFTYEDDVLARLDAVDDGARREPNQRNVGVAAPAGPVHVAGNHPRNHAGDWFSVLVTRTVAKPQPGSDGISKAFEEGWIGRDGYVRAGGERQKYALAFQGMVTALDGRQHAEVFVVDLPEDLTQPDRAPLGGTTTTRPAPPYGVQQRRLTFTDVRKFPGVAAAPRHWLRVSPDGSVIAFLMKDDAGIVQFWTVSPNGGESRQITHNSAGVSSAFTWSADGLSLAHIMDGSVCVTEIATGETTRLTARSEGPSAPASQACVFSPDGRTIAYTREIAGEAGSFQQIFTASVPFPAHAR
jgi:Protein of unknown function (DUF3748)/WD40-like Beta Propeller Repeat